MVKGLFLALMLMALHAPASHQAIKAGMSIIDNNERQHHCLSY
jgi:hypothetical protein